MVESDHVFRTTRLCGAAIHEGKSLPALWKIFRRWDHSPTLPRANSRTMIDLPDDVLILALCVNPERLADPALWCDELRALSGSVPESSQESEDLMDRWAWLREEAGR